METNEQGLIALYESAEKMSEKGKFEDAVSEFGKIMELAPRNPLAAKAAKSIGDIYNDIYEDSRNDIQDNKKALQYYEKAIEIDPSYLEAYFDLGGAYFNQNNWDEALEQYNKVLNSNPSIELKAKCISEIGFVYLAQEKYDDALREYNKILDLDVDNNLRLDVLEKIGSTNVVKGDIHKALEIFNKRKEMDSSLEDGHFQLASSIYYSKDANEAIDYLKKIIESYPDSELAAKAFYEIGNVYVDDYEVKDLHEAETNYRETIKINPKSKIAAKALNNIGQIYQNQKKKDNAIEMYKEVIKIDPDFEEAHYNLAATLEEKKMHKEALLEINEAIKLNPNNSSNYNVKGNIYWRKEYPKAKAIEAYKEAIKLDPTSYWPYDNLARLYEARKQTKEEAIEMWINCLKYADVEGKIGKVKKHLQKLGLSEGDIEMIKSEKPPISPKIPEKTKESSEKPIKNDYSMDALRKKTYLSSSFFMKINDLLEEKHQVIFYGVPGTGKTFIAKNFADYFTNCVSEADSKKKVKLIQFHQSYSYEEFMEGIRPEPLPENKGMSYPIKNGIFREFCNEAEKNIDEKYLLIIDEINRGNTSKIFGELLYLLEYRDEQITLPYSKEPFSIPNNVYIIGTMNTADRSIALVDYALRRRFYFVEFQPDTELLEKWLSENRDKKSGIDVSKLFNKLNAKLINDIDAHHQIGHSYFMIKEGKLDENRLKLIWDYNIIPLLREYFFTKTDLNEYSFESMING